MSEIAAVKKKPGFFTGRRGRHLKEYLTAYAFIFPSVFLIFLFGIFPVGFALYVSMHKWRLKRGDFIGMANYTRALDNLAYVIAFFLAIGALVGLYFVIKRIIETAREYKEQPWLQIISGLLSTGAVFLMLRWAVFLLPEILDIADKVKGLEKTQELFLRLISEALVAERVLPAWWQFFGALIIAIAVGWWLRRLQKGPRTLNYQLQFTLAAMALAAGLGLGWFTYTEISAVYTAAFEGGTDPGIWPYIVTVGSGIILLILAWFIFRSAENETKTRNFWFKVLATMALLVGGWLLIGEIPTIFASGNKDMWSGLKVTVFFSLGTVPFQLAISLFLSILLFQKIAGSNAFRILYFLPYVTPAVASAAIFKQIFSNRATSPSNLLLGAIGMEPLQWLYEPDGIFSMLMNGLGVQNWPEWAAGPSLALCVVMLHSIWTYVGYDTVIYMAGLGNIPRELIDAAAVDGASKWEVFRHIIFPLLSPTTYFLSLIAIIGTFKAFNTLWIFRDSLALGTTDTFSLVIFLEFFEKLRYGYASALSFILFGIILCLTIINNRIQGSRVFYG
jgi:multiple sugar transport system permease protein